MRACKVYFAITMNLTSWCFTQTTTWGITAWRTTTKIIYFDHFAKCMCLIFILSNEIIIIINFKYSWKFASHSSPSFSPSSNQSSIHAFSAKCMPTLITTGPPNPNLNKSLLPQHQEGNSSPFPDPISGSGFKLQTLIQWKLMMMEITSPLRPI